jgi:hypothetical protein
MYEDNNVCFFKWLTDYNNIVQVVGHGFYGRSKLWEGTANGTIVGNYRCPYALAAVSKSMERTDIKFDTLECSTNNPTVYDDYDYLGAYANELKAADSNDLILDYDDIEECSFVDVTFNILNRDRIQEENGGRVGEKCSAEIDRICSFLETLKFPKPLILAAHNRYHVLFPVVGFDLGAWYGEIVGNISLLGGMLGDLIESESVTVSTECNYPHHTVTMPGAKATEKRYLRHMRWEAFVRSAPRRGSSEPIFIDDFVDALKVLECLHKSGFKIIQVEKD